MKTMQIGNTKIDQKSSSYIIAEIGLNHQGDIKIAKELVHRAVIAKANCAKFQKRSLSKVYKQDVLDDIENEEQGSQYLLKNIIKSELTNQELLELAQYCEQQKIDFMCTPWDSESLAFLSTLNPPAYKVGSPDMTNLPLLKEVALLDKPMLISTGMSFVSEIEQVARFLNDLNADYIFLHCNSTYPAPYSDINLKFLSKLATMGSGLVGYSGHDTGISISIAAVALGACIIEKHLTLDRYMEGPDHRASLEPDEFAEMVKQIRIVEQSLGEATRFMSRGEYLNRQTLSKSLVAAHNLKQGQTLHETDITVKSPGKGTTPLKMSHFVGHKLIQRDVDKDDYLLESDVAIRPQGYELSNLKTNHKWGVVARMSDIDELLGCNSDFIEIHLSDSDINKPLQQRRTIDRELVVHGPEYNEDLLLDLSHPVEKIRSASVAFFNQAFGHARELKKFFKQSEKLTKFVIHPGGYFMDKARLDMVQVLNQQLLKSLQEIDAEGFEPLVENMPCCPWFFGGQWFSSNFMAADEIVRFSQKTGFGIVFDVSHAALYCNFYQQDLVAFTKTILPVVKYIHISDSSGTNDEGLQIGDGSIDFSAILDILVETDLWFLPEVWQGHKFHGEGFVKAVDRLKTINSDF